MNTVLEPLQRWAFDALPVLLDVAAKGMVLLAIAGVLVLAMRKASAAARQVVWLLALAALLALPLVSAALPSWRVLPGWVKFEMPVGSAEPASPSPADSPPAESGQTDPLQGAGQARMHPGPPTALTDDTSEPGTSSPPAVAHEQAPQATTDTTGAGSAAGQSRWTWAVLLSVAIWLAGTIVCLLPLLLGRISLWWLARHSRRITGGVWATLSQRAAQAVGLTRRVSLLQSSDEPMPMVWGTFRPKLLLPAEAEHWPVERRWVVLLHELAHAKRRDCLAKLVAHVTCAFYWFNPLCWMAFKLMQREAEAACDDLVLSGGALAASAAGEPSSVRPSDYAEHLLEIASGLKSGMLATYNSIAMARKSKLEGRLLAILDATRNRRALTRIGIIILAALIAAVAIPLAVIRATGQDNSEVASLIEQLKSEDEYTRELAAERLSEMGPAVAEPVSRLFAQGGPGDAHAVQVLETMAKDPDVQALMRKGLDSRNSNVVHCSLVVLGKSGNRAHVAAIVPLLEKNTIAASVALSQLGGDEAFQALLAALNKPNIGPRWLIAEHLAGFGRPEAIPEIKKALARLTSDEMATVGRYVDAIHKLEGGYRSVQIVLTNRGDRGWHWLEGINLDKMATVYVNPFQPKGTEQQTRAAAYQALSAKEGPVLAWDQARGNRLLAFNGLKLALYTPAALPKGYNLWGDGERFLDQRRLADVVETYNAEGDVAELEHGVRAYPFVAGQDFLALLPDGRVGILRPKEVKTRGEDVYISISLMLFDPLYKLIPPSALAATSPQASTQPVELDYSLSSTFPVTDAGITVIHVAATGNLRTGWTGLPKGELGFGDFSMQVDENHRDDLGRPQGMLTSKEGKAIPVVSLVLGNDAAWIKEVVRDQASLPHVGILLPDADLATVEKVWRALPVDGRDRWILLVPGKIAEREAISRLRKQAAEVKNTSTEPAGVQLNGPPWEVRLPNGVVVELVGLADSPSTGKAWWQPDGRPLADRPYTLQTAPFGSRTWDDLRAVELAYRVRSSGRSEGGLIRLSAQGKGGACVSKSESGEAVSADAQLFQKDQETTDIRIGAASGPWKPIGSGVLDGNGAVQSFKLDDGYGVLEFTDPPHGANDVVFSAIMDESWINLNWQFIVTDDTGKAHRLNEASSIDTWVKDRPGLMHRDFARWWRTDAKLVTLRLEVQPIHYAEFQNVSLLPGKKTAVRVVTGICGESPTTQPAAGATSELMPSETLGRIVDMSGKGVAGAVVSSTKPPWTATTDSDGRFHLPIIDPGSPLILTIRAAGYAFREDLSLHRLADGTYGPDKGVFELHRAGRLEGKVLGPDGRPLAAAPLSVSTIQQYRHIGIHTSNHLRAITDAEGQFVIDAVPPGLLLLMYPWQGPSAGEVTAGKWAAWTKPGERYPSAPIKGVCAAVRIELGDGQTIKDRVVDLSQSTAAVEGQVLDRAGRPVPNAKVALYWKEKGGWLPVASLDYPPAMTDANGRYRLERLPVGSWHIGAWLGDGRAEPVPVELSSNKTARADLRMAALLEEIAAPGTKPVTQPAADPAEIARLVEQLASDDAAEREAAKAALVKIGEPAIEPLRVATGRGSDGAYPEGERLAALALTEIIKDTAENEGPLRLTMIFNRQSYLPTENIYFTFILSTSSEKDVAFGLGVELSLEIRGPDGVTQVAKDGPPHAFHISRDKPLCFTDRLPSSFDIQKPGAYQIVARFTAPPNGHDVVTEPYTIHVVQSDQEEVISRRDVLHRGDTTYRYELVKFTDDGQAVFLLRRQVLNSTLPKGSTIGGQRIDADGLEKGVLAEDPVFINGAEGWKIALPEGVTLAASVPQGGSGAAVVWRKIPLPPDELVFKQLGPKYSPVVVEDSNGVRYALDGTEPAATQPAAQPAGEGGEAADESDAAEVAAPEKATVELSGRVVDDETGELVKGFALQEGWPDPKDPSKISWGGGTHHSSLHENGSFSVQQGMHKGRILWLRVLADGYLPQPVTPEPLTAPASAQNLEVRLKRGLEVHGRVVDHTSKPVAGAKVFLGGYQGLHLVDGEAECFYCSRTTTDKEGAFVLAGVGEGADSITVSAPSLHVWQVPLTKPDEEILITLPQPATLVLRYDIEGDEDPGQFHLHLKTREMKDWKGVGSFQEPTVANKGTTTLSNVTPGVYDLFRMKELRVGQQGGGALCDRRTITLDAGKTSEVEFVRKTGHPITGEVVGLKEAGVPGALIYVKPAAATGDPLKTDEWKLTTFDALTCGEDGQFKTARIPPGTYTVIVYAYNPEPRTNIFYTGVRLPDFIGTAKVTVPENAPPPPVRIELKPRPGAWGTAVEGVHCRLRADKLEWKVGDTLTFKADVWNRGERELLVCQSQSLCELEFDGQWYAWAGEVDVKSSGFGPGRHYGDIPIALDEHWQSKQDHKPLPLSVGEHSVYVAFTAPSAKPGEEAPVRFISNRVEIEIVPAEPSLPPTGQPAAQPADSCELAFATEGLRLEPYPEGGLYTVTAVIENKGSRPAGPFGVRFYYRGRPGSSQPAEHTAGPIKPNETFRERTLPFALTEGVNEVFVELDWRNEIHEADETDNKATLEVTVKDGKVVGKTFIADWPATQPADLTEAQRHEQWSRIHLGQCIVLSSSSARMTGEVAFNKIVPVLLAGGAGQDPAVLRLAFVVFERTDVAITAKLYGQLISYPKGKWRIGMDLLPSANGSLRKEVVIENSGVVIGLPVVQSGHLAFAFAVPPELPAGARFAVTISPAEADAPANGSFTELDYKALAQKRHFRELPGSGTIAVDVSPMPQKIPVQTNLWREITEEPPLEMALLFPLHGRPVYWESDGRIFACTHGYGGSSPANADFVRPDIPGGVYRLSMNSRPNDGFIAGSTDSIRLAGDGVIAQGQLEWFEGASLTIRLVDRRSGWPGASVPVLLRLPNGLPIYMRADDHGQLRLDHLPPGRLTAEIGVRDWWSLYRPESIKTVSLEVKAGDDKTVAVDYALDRPTYRCAATQPAMQPQIDKAFLEYIEALAEEPGVKIEPVAGAAEAYAQATAEGRRASGAAILANPSTFAQPEELRLSNWRKSLAAPFPIYESFVRKYPLTPEGLRTLNLLGVEYARVGQFEEGVRLLTAALKLARGTPIEGILNINLAWAQMEAGQLDAAEMRLREIVTLAPPTTFEGWKTAGVTRFLAQTYLAEVEVKRGRLAEAHELLTAVADTAVAKAKEYPSLSDFFASYAGQAYTKRIVLLLDRKPPDLALARRLAEEFQALFPDYKGPAFTYEVMLTYLRAATQPRDHELPDGFVVQGVIVSDSGEPMPDVNVRASAGWDTLRRTGFTTTDAQGRYTLRFGPGILFERPTLNFQAAVIFAEKAGYFETSLCRQGDLRMSNKMPPKETLQDWPAEKVVLPGEPVTVNFEMAPAASAQVQLVDQQDEPLPDHRLWLTAEKTWPASNVLFGARTDEEGCIHWSGIPTGLKCWFEAPRRGRRSSSKSGIIQFEPGQYNVKLRLIGSGSSQALEIVESVKPSATTQPAGSKLEFRVAPKSSDLDKAELASYMDWLEAGKVGFWWKGGPIRGRVPDHAWLPISGELPNSQQLVTGEHDGQKYVLVSDKPGQTMVPGEGKDAWGLAKVYATKDGRDQPAIGFELDARGAELFAALTKANINNALAIVVGGKVVSAPIIKTALSKAGIIIGQFTEQEVNALVQALLAGMPPAS